MSEKQNIEYKSSWHNDHLKVICGFANANGGTLYIGKNDQGRTVGVKNHKELMETLPNKILDALGVVAKVNLRREKNLHYLEIKTPAYSVPISLRGRYYYRSGSVKRELTGMALNEFMYKKMGKTWDEVIDDRARLSDVDKKSVEAFLKSAEETKRFPVKEKLPLKDLLTKLELMDNGKLRKAALVMFAKQPGQFFPSMRIQIGRFEESKVNLRFQESIEGNLIHCLNESMEQLYHKFFVRVVSFRGVQRIETWQFPVDAIREILLNALIHKNYMGAHIQFEVYDDHIRCWNEGRLPEEVPLGSLKKRHRSKPRNPFVANACFKGGYIDAWGRGIEKIMNACKAEDLPEPEFEETCGGVEVTLFGHKTVEGQAESQPESGTKLALSRHQVEVLRECLLDSKIGELMELSGRSDRTKYRDQVLNPLLEEGLIEMTIPGKPRSSKQKYRLTDKGREALGK